MKYLILPCYKNVPQIFFIKIIDEKNLSIEKSEEIKESMIQNINSRIEQNEDIENEQKAYEFMMLENNISIYILGINDDGKPNKLYAIKQNPRNNKKTLETISINGASEMPLIKIFNYIKKPKNIPFVN